jgi:hypothetical protein
MNTEAAQRNDLESKESQARPVPEVGCSMASMCNGLFAQTPSRLLLMLPGAVLILLGVTILIQPQVLVWLAAAAAVLVGVAMLLMANFLYRFGAKARIAGG